MKNKVERAVIFAAGLGSRLLPLTEDCPKPLIRINGKRIIDTLLDAVTAAGIEEIYIVRGFLAEKFDELKGDYPTIKFIDNPYYQNANNISSLVCAGNLIENAYIIEGDLFLQNPSLITACQAESNYLSIPVENTDDWCFFTDSDGVINKMSVGGENCEQMVGISYWTAKDGEKLAQCAKELYADVENHGLYWDQVALEKYLPRFKIKTRKCSFDDVTEIDTVEELRAFEDYMKRGSKFET